MTVYSLQELFFVYSFSSDFEDDVPACKGPVENRKTKGKLQSKGSKSMT